MDIVLEDVPCALVFFSVCFLVKTVKLINPVAKEFKSLQETNTEETAMSKYDGHFKDMNSRSCYENPKS